jgi:hypothetical protein
MREAVIQAPLRHHNHWDIDVLPRPKRWKTMEETRVPCQRLNKVMATVCSSIKSWVIYLREADDLNLCKKESVQSQQRSYGRRVHRFTTQTPTPLKRPSQPHQNFDDFSKSLEKSKNFIYYEEYSNYHEYCVIFAKLCC